MASGGDDNSALLSLDPVVQEARKRFDRCSEWESVWRQKFIEDIKFANGDSQNGFQWPNEIRNLRERSSRPCLTMNLIKPHNRMITNEARKNKSSVRYIGMGNGATQDMANVYQDLHRHIEYLSSAQSAYSTAQNFQVDGGLGYWRIITDYTNPESWDVEPLIVPVNDPLMIYMDPDAQRLDRLDAKFAFAFDDVDKDEFDDAYPEFLDMIGHQPLGMGTSVSDWVTKNKIRVVEYFRKVPQRKQIMSFTHLGERVTISHEKLEALVLDREARDRIVSDPSTRHKTVWDSKVEWYLIAGEKIIDQTIWPGRYIPIIPCVGDEIVIDGHVDRKGNTRAMLDAQRMFNYNNPLALSTPIPTPHGWTTMGEIKVGDEVLNELGQAVPVVGMSSIFKDRNCYEISFDNGTKIVADASHSWTIEERGKRTSRGETWLDKTITTVELQPKKHFICSTEPLDLPAIKDLPIHPYVLGLWLGDGDSDSAQITTHADDVEETCAHVRACGHSVGEIHFSGVNNSAIFNINGIRSLLKTANLKNDKHIPFSYLRASIEQRYALLQGLMDSDGHVTPNHQCVFVNGNAELIAGVLELLYSLGIKPSITKQFGREAIFPNGKVYKGNNSFRISFSAEPDIQVFRLSRKRVVQEEPRETHWRRTRRIGIVAIREVSSVAVRCISVDSEKHLFLAGPGMVPTHNSAQIEFGALQVKTPWIAPAKAIEEFEAVWRTANQDNPAILPFNHVDPEHPDVPLPPPQRIEPPSVSPSYQLGAEAARQHMMMVTGQYENTLGEQGNERTGAAINARRAQGATATYHFQDNYETALIATGKQLIDLFPKIYDTKRVKRIVNDDGIEYDLEIDPALRAGYLEHVAHDGKIIKKALNPLVGHFDVAATVGPSYDSKRQETADSLALILTQAPNIVPIVADILLKNLPFEGAQEAALRMRRMVPPQALGDGPTKNEQMLQQQLVGLRAELTKLLDKNAADRLKLVGKDQLRDIEAYKAETERFKALQEALPMDPEGLKAVVEQLVNESLNTSVAEVAEENESTSNGDASAKPKVPEPPVPNAKQAPDGHWYIPDPTNRAGYMRVEGPANG